MKREEGMLRQLVKTAWSRGKDVQGQERHECNREDLIPMPVRGETFTGGGLLSPRTIITHGKSITWFSPNIRN